MDTGAYPLGFGFDGDGDGMPDWWEEKYGLIPTSNDAGGNPDGDAYTNVEEFRRGLHPGVADFVFVINAEGNIFLLDTGGEFVDSDADGIPNWWERKHTGNPTAMSATDDDDHDGQSNLDEYIAGLDPGDARSVFEVGDLTVDEDPQGMMIVRWLTQPGRLYRLYFADSPAGLTGAPTFTVDGDGSEKTREVPRAGRAAMFCRISVEWPGH